MYTHCPKVANWLAQLPTLLILYDMKTSLVPRLSPSPGEPGDEDSKLKQLHMCYLLGWIYMQQCSLTCSDKDIQSGGSHAVTPPHLA